MKIILLSEDSIRLEPEPGPMTIEASSADQLYSPFHMLASGLAFCTFSILHSWAGTVKLDADDLVIEVRWSFAEEPHRVGTLDVTLEWPGLPPARRGVAERVAALCPIHGTLQHPPAITIAVGQGQAALEAAGVGALDATPEREA